MKTAITEQALQVINKWKEAKKNEAGWASIRKEAQEKLLEIYGKEIELAFQEIDMTEAMSTSMKIYDYGGNAMFEINRIGWEFKVNQPAAHSFIQKHPDTQGVLLMVDYKVKSREVAKEIWTPGELGPELQKIVEVKQPSKGFKAL